MATEAHTTQNTDTNVKITNHHIGIHSYAIIPRILQFLAWIPASTVFYVFFRGKFIGTKNFKHLKAPFIFAANHASEWDPIVITAGVPWFSSLLPMFYVGRPASFYKNLGIHAHIIYHNWFFKAWGSFPAIPNLKDYGKSFKYIEPILKDGHILIIFPGGGFTKDGRIREARGGVAYLAHKINCPIVPVKIKGLERMNMLELILRRRRVTVTYGKPIYPADLFKNTPVVNEERNDYKKVAQEIVEKIESL